MLQALSSLAVFAAGASAALVPYTFNVGNTNLSPDGFQRSMVTVNGIYPGTLITANKGDTVQITVNNQLTDATMRRSTSIHWHGLFLSRNAHDDGPAFVTQCPIAPGHSYTYNLPLSDQAGTFWYHSHLSSQYVDGLRGGFIIYDPNDPNLSLYDVDNAGTVIQIGDHYHTPAVALQDAYLSATNTAGQEPVPDSVLINGKGRYNGGAAVDRAVIEVTRNLRYRFRVINTSAIGSYRFAIQGHPFTVIEADGINHQSLNVDYFQIHAGQRYSVIVHANQPVGNYWITAPITVRGAATNTNLLANGVAAILRYAGAPAEDPAGAIPTTVTGTQLLESNLKPLENPGAPGGNAPADRVLNVTFARATDGSGRPAFTINGSQYHSPSVPTLLKIMSGATQDSDFDPSENTLVLERNQVIEVNVFGGPNHPIHLHGHAFDVVQSQTGSANYQDPPRRDVVASAAGTTGIKFRFRTDNPGPWIVHCHIDWHLEAGLAFVFAEAPSDAASGPSSVLVDADWQNLCPIYNALDPSLQ